MWILWERRDNGWHKKDSCESRATLLKAVCALQVAGYDGDNFKVLSEEVDPNEHG